MNSTTVGKLSISSQTIHTVPGFGGVGFGLPKAAVVPILEKSPFLDSGGVWKQPKLVPAD